MNRSAYWWNDEACRERSSCIRLHGGWVGGLSEAVKRYRYRRVGQEIGTRHRDGRSDWPVCWNERD